MSYGFTMHTYTASCLVRFLAMWVWSPRMPLPMMPLPSTNHFGILVLSARCSCPPFQAAHRGMPAQRMQRRECRVHGAGPQQREGHGKGFGRCVGEEAG